MKKILLSLYPVLIIALLVYSYTQVDLNLTLFRSNIWISFQRWAQHIGYFDRPLSTLIFLLITSLLFLFYFGFLRVSNKLTKKEIWFLILSTSFILTLSYNAFSYDFFNYIFDAKIVTFYHQNPYIHRALDYTSDPMLLFMHWTHRLYPYGSAWLILTVPLSFIGKALFLPTFFMFKLLITLFFLGIAYFIGKIVSKINPEDEKFAVLFFALNPLVIIESLVSSHNDIVMMFFAILAFYFLISKRSITSIIYLILSIGIKYATLFLVPVWFYVLKKKKNIDFERVISFSVILMFAAVLVATFRLTFQPWYWLYVLPLIALISKKHDLYKAGIVVSAFSLFTYTPFLYFGNWDAPSPTIIFWSVALSIVLSVSLIVRKLW